MSCMAQIDGTHSRVRGVGGNSSPKVAPGPRGWKVGLIHGEAGSSRCAGSWLQQRSTFLSRAPVHERRTFSLNDTLTFIDSIYYLYVLVRRPRMILDFTLTLLFNHLVLTTYYSSAVPTSLFFWAIVLGSAALTIIVAEQMCVKREMNEGLVVATTGTEEEDVEMGGLLRRD